LYQSTQSAVVSFSIVAGVGPRVGLFASGHLSSDGEFDGYGEWVPLAVGTESTVMA
jgi:hypothetical protein